MQAEAGEVADQLSQLVSQAKPEQIANADFVSEPFEIPSIGLSDFGDNDLSSVGNSYLSVERYANTLGILPSSKDYRVYRLPQKFSAKIKLAEFVKEQGMKPGDTAHIVLPNAFTLKGAQKWRERENLAPGENSLMDYSRDKWGQMLPLKMQEDGSLTVDKEHARQLNAIGKAYELRQDQWRASGIDQIHQARWDWGEQLDPIDAGGSQSKYAIAEDQLAAAAAMHEMQAFGRRPSAKTAEQYEIELKEQATNWATSKGFEPGGANGFTAEQTAAHDIAHPATFQLARLSSEDIHKTFGNLRDKDGKPSLIAEEALVNIVEHLSRGDNPDASILNGIRLAKVLSRAGSKEEQAYVRSKAFAIGIGRLAIDRILRADDFEQITDVVRKYNRISTTVQARGDDFTNSASGG